MQHTKHPKSRKHQKHTKHTNFTTIPISFNFPLTINKEDIHQLITRAIDEGIGDWAIIEEAPHILPIQILDIETNQAHTLTKAKLLRSIRTTLIDFPYALDPTAGYILNISKLTQEDIDEIIQVAIFRELRYQFN